jgi:hypothetical protein
LRLGKRLKVHITPVLLLSTRDSLRDLLEQRFHGNNRAGHNVRWVQGIEDCAEGALTSDWASTVPIHLGAFFVLSRAETPLHDGRENYALKARHERSDTEVDVIIGCLAGWFEDFAVEEAEE